MEIVGRVGVETNLEKGSVSLKRRGGNSVTKKK